MSGPIEVWLRRTNLAVRGFRVHEDESTEAIATSSLSMRGAQRDLTAQGKAAGLAPVGRWSAEAFGPNGEILEAFRRFSPMQ